MSTSGTSSGRPDEGSAVYFDSRNVMTDCTAPMKMPASTAMIMLSNPATTAAARAGTMKRVYATGTSGTMGAMRMPASPATAELSIQLYAAIRSGETPLR